MSKPVFTHEDMMREIAARAELRLQTYEEDRAGQSTPVDLRPRSKPASKTYKFH